MTHLSNLPNEMIIKIITCLPSNHLIHLNLVSKFFRKLVKGTTWSHFVLRKFRYLAAGYRFRKYSEQIGERKLWANFTDTQYTNALANLSKCSEVTITESTIMPEHMVALAKVSKLAFKTCWFSEVSNEDFNLLSNVQSLRITMCRGMPLDRLVGLNIHELKVVEPFGGDYISDNELKILSNIPKLSIIKQMAITDNGFSCLSGVRELDLYGCSQITDAAMVHLSHVTKLKLSGCAQITDRGLKYLTNVNELHLDERFNEYPNITIDGIKCLSHLTSLSLAGRPDVTDDWLKHLGHCDKLNLSMCNNITDRGLQYLTGVKELDIGHCDKITDVGLEYLANVTKLNIGWCRDIKGTGLTYTRNLIELTIALNRINLVTIIPHITNIRSLELLGCYDLTNDELSNIKLLSKLKKFKLYSARKCTNDGLIHLSNIQYIEIFDNNDTINQDGFKHLWSIKKIIYNYNIFRNEVMY